MATTNGIHRMSKGRASSSTSSNEDAPYDPIDAMPTKELFIGMLTRDIVLIPSIADLVDNSTDGAQRMRGESSLDGLFIRINVGAKSFKISDNCGGIDIDTAKNYAFRFGRPADSKIVKHSVGRFGVGMKRALFKMGRKINIQSSTKNSTFLLYIDVEKWASSPDWQFEFKKLEEGLSIPASKQGTTIEITDLRQAVYEEFQLPSFVTELKRELEHRIRHAINRGLKITINGIPLEIESVSLLQAKKIEPVEWNQTYKEKQRKPVKVKIICGLGSSSDREMAGWHVYCNGRLVLFGDKSSQTGWGDRTGEISIPGFHGQYNMFRGFVFLDSDDPDRLPWNTTKTGINCDSNLWRSVRFEMKKLMLPVKTFLDSLKSEKDETNQMEAQDAGELETLVKSADSVALEKAKTRKKFIAPAPIKKRTSPRVGNIHYSKPLDRLLAAKKSLNVSTFRDVGEQTFEYYYEAEIRDE